MYHWDLTHTAHRQRSMFSREWFFLENVKSGSLPHTSDWQLKLPTFTFSNPGATSRPHLFTLLSGASLCVTTNKPLQRSFYPAKQFNLRNHRHTTHAVNTEQLLGVSFFLSFSFPSSFICLPRPPPFLSGFLFSALGVARYSIISVAPIELPVERALLHWTPQRHVCLHTGAGHHCPGILRG